jgi:dynein heavy chain
VTDQWDARLLNVIVREVFTEDLLTQKDFNFCGEMGGPYRLPPASDENLTSMKNKMGVNFGAIFSGFRNDLLSFVKDLPEHELPEVFGQHINAEITIRIEDSKNFLDALTTLDSAPSPTDATPTNENEFSLSNFVGELLEKLPVKISIADFNDKIKAANKDSLGGFVDLVTIFFMQEAKKYNVILDAVRNDLQTVQGCLKGKIMLTEEIEATLTQVNNMRLPRRWQSFYASAKPLNLWYEDLEKRVAQIVEWQAKGYLVKYWLGGFIYPTGFLTAVLQTTARRSNISIDNLKWDFQFLGTESYVNSPPKDGVYVYGMLLEGGKFRGSDNKLVEADPMVLYSQMPVVYFKPVEKNAKAITKANIYNCPVYIYPIRKGANDVSSYLFSMSLPFAGQKEITENFWVKRGTAILLSLDN